METAKIALSRMLGEVIELPKKDFRLLRVVYTCEAGGMEEVCRNYSPGPGGKCSFQDFSSPLVLCRKEGE